MQRSRNGNRRNAFVGGMIVGLALLASPSSAAVAVASDAGGDGLDPALVLYVAVPGSDVVQVRDAATGGLLNTIEFPAGSAPEQLIATPDSSRVFVRGDSWVGYIDPATNTGHPLGLTVVDSYGMALSADGTKLFVEDDGDPDQSAMAILYEIVVSSGAVRGIPLLSTEDFATSGVAASPDGSVAYLSGETFGGDAQTYLHVDVATGRVSAVPAPHVHESVAVSWDGNELFLGRVASNDFTVDVFESATGQFAGSWAGTGSTPRNAAGLLPALDDASLYVVRSTLDGGTGVANAGVERVWAQDGSPLASWASAVELAAYSISQSPDGSTVYVADVNGTVTTLDAYGLSVQNQWSAAASISGVAAAIIPRQPEIVTPNAATLTAGTIANTPVNAVGHPTPTVTITGELPPGVGYTSETFGRGSLTGTPTTAGQWSVTVAADNAEGHVEQQLLITVNPGPAADLAAVSGNGQHAASGAEFREQLRIQVTDANGNPVATSTAVTFDVSPEGAAAFAGLGSITVTTDRTGIAVSPFLTAGSTPGPIEVTASAPNLNDAVFSLRIGEQVGEVPDLPPTVPSPSTPVPPQDQPGGQAAVNGSGFASGILAATGSQALWPAVIVATFLALTGSALIVVRRFRSRRLRA